jgi:hypothetical protein
MTPAPIADGGDAVERALHAGAVVGVEGTDALGDVVDLCAGDLFVREDDFTFDKAGGGQPPKVNDDLQQVVAVVRLFHGVTNVGGEDVQKGVEVVCNSVLSHMLSFSFHVSGDTSGQRGKRKRHAKIFKRGLGFKGEGEE